MEKRTGPVDAQEWEEKPKTNLEVKLKNYNELTENISKLSEVYKKRRDLDEPKKKFRCK
jgi:hypothetical protein